MKITGLEPASSKRFRVYIDGEHRLVLYQGELSRHHLEAGSEVPEELWKRLREENIKKAKLRAMHLLNDMDRTESQLLKKLTDGGYPEDIAREALSYVKSFGYVNDRAYIRRFAEGRMHSKSRKEIQSLLSQKGLDSAEVREVLAEVYEEEEAEPEQEAIRALLRKKRWKPEEMDEKEYRRMLAFFARKGFRYEDIRQVTQLPPGNA